ncbi:MAG: hypothetical protein KIG72_10135 [Bradymonadales bacterium]|nr:hypothetical protein [Bradymonadales bacterium]
MPQQFGIAREPHSAAQSPSIGNPSHATHPPSNEELEQIAAFLCKMSLGAFPNWALYPMYREYLAPGEEEAIALMADVFEDEFSSAWRDRYRAITRFYANHALCQRIDPHADDAPALEQNPSPADLLASESALALAHRANPSATGDPASESAATLSNRANPSAAGDSQRISRDDLGNYHFVFDQQLPVVPNLPDSPKSPSADGWLETIESAWQGDYRHYKVRIILSIDDTGHVFLNSDVKHQYVEPLESQRIARYTSPEQLNLAERWLAGSCKRKTAACRDLAPFLDAAKSYTATSQELWANATSVKIDSMKTIQRSGSRQDTVVVFDIDNPSLNTFSHIVFATKETKPRHCELRAFPDSLGDSLARLSERHTQPFVANPNSSAKALCFIDGTLRPDIELKILIASYKTPKFVNTSALHKETQR